MKNYQLRQNLPWSKISDYLLDIGRVDTAKQFCVSAFQKMNDIIAFDKGALHILDESLNIADQVLIDINPSTVADFYDYYSKLDGGRFCYTNTRPAEVDWNRTQDCEFKRDYIKPQGIRVSATFHFYSQDNWLTAAFSINRTVKSCFTQVERETIRIIRQHLNNLYGIFTRSVNQHPKKNTLKKSPFSLTPRQTEIVDLIACGMSPSQISKRKCISLHTVYNHLCQIYKKVNVSSQRELLAMVMQKDSAVAGP